MIISGVVAAIVLPESIGAIASIVLFCLAFILIALAFMPSKNATISLWLFFISMLTMGSCFLYLFYSAMIVNVPLSDPMMRNVGAVVFVSMVVLFFSILATGSSADMRSPSYEKEIIVTIKDFALGNGLSFSDESNPNELIMKAGGV